MGGRVVPTRTRDKWVITMLLHNFDQLLEGRCGEEVVIQSIAVIE